MKQRNLCADLSVKKQGEHYSQLVDSSSGNQRSLFKVVEEVLDKKDDRILPTHTDPLVLANEFNEYYIEKIDKLRESIPPAVETEPTNSTFKGKKLQTFHPTNVQEIKEIIKEYGIKTSSEDPIPVKILGSVIEVTLPTLEFLVNKSLEEGSVEGIKHSVIDPLLKKSGLDSEIKKNYRPVNNLVFFSKLIERIVLKRLDGHMNENNLNNDDAFGYKKHHSTETMMLGISNDILTGFDDNKCTVMMFLDLSAAFDTIDITKLLTILSQEIGLSGMALKWCESFHRNRTQRVKINGKYSKRCRV